MGTSIQLVGVEELLKALKELPDDVQKKVVQNALVEASQPVLDDMEANAPKRTGIGKLSFAITTKLNKSQYRLAKKLGKYETAIYLGPTLHVGWLYLREFGSRIRGGTRHYTGSEAAKPFVRPAFDAGWKGIIERFGAILGVEIKLAFERVYKPIRGK